MGCVPCDVCFVLWREMVRRRAGSRRRWQPAPGSVWSNPVGARPPEARGAPRLGAAVCIVAHQRRRAHVTPQRQRCSVSRPPDQPCSLHPRPALILVLSWRELWPWPPSPRRVPRALPVHHRTLGCFGGPRTCNRCQKGGLSRGGCPNCTPGNLPARPHPPAPSQASACGRPQAAVSHRQLGLPLPAVWVPGRALAVVRLRPTGHRATGRQRQHLGWGSGVTGDGEVEDAGVPGARLTPGGGPGCRWSRSRRGQQERQASGQASAGMWLAGKNDGPGGEWPGRAGGSEFQGSEA